jgi:hypothetical protein
LENRTAQIKTFVEAQETLRDAQLGTSDSSIGGVQGTFNSAHLHTGADGSDRLDLQQAYDNAATSDAVIKLAAAGSFKVTDSADAELFKVDEATGKLSGADIVGTAEIDWGTGADQVNADDIPDGSTNAIVSLAQETAWDAHLAQGVESDHGANLKAAAYQPADITATGGSSVVTTQMSGETAGGSASVAGVVTTAPDNKVLIKDANLDDVSHSGGGKVYGRITESGGVWTLNYYYTDGSGNEQAYTDFSSTPIKWWVQKTYAAADLPFQSDAFTLMLDQSAPTINLSNVVGDILPATDATQNLGSDTKAWLKAYFGDGAIRFDPGTGKLQFSHDNSTFEDIGSGGASPSVYQGYVKDMFLNKLESIAGRDGLYAELYLNKDKVDYSIEDDTISMASVNGDLREAPFNQTIAEWFQTDRADDDYPIADGALSPCYKPYYGEVVDSWNLKKYMVQYSYGIAYDSVTDSFFVLNSDSQRITRVSKDFSVSYGSWTVDNASQIGSAWVEGNDLYISDYNFSTYGRITKHTLNADRSKIDSQASGSSLPDTTSVVGTASYHLTFDLTSDGTYLYVVCATTNNIGKITLSTFSSWDSSIDISSYVASGAARGIAYDGTDLFISDPTSNTITKIKIDGAIGYNRFSFTNARALAYVNGDLFACESTNMTVNKIAIKNTRTLKGQPKWIKQLAVSAATGAYHADLLGAGVGGWLICQSGLFVKVLDDNLDEVTTGSVRSTTFSAGDSGLVELYAADFDGTNVILSGSNGTTTHKIMQIPISALSTGSFTFVNATHQKYTKGGDFICNIKYIPGETNYALAGIRAGTNEVYVVNLTAGTAVSAFEFPIGMTDVMWFDFYNNDKSQLHCWVGESSPVKVVDFNMSRYMGAGNQPYVVDIYFPTMHLSNQMLGFNGDENLVFVGSTLSKPTTVVAVADADDENVTGQNQRNVRYYSSSVPSLAPFKTYPAITYQGANVKKTIRYRRKYAPSVYSSQHNVLPLDGLYVVGSWGLSIIDLESNTEFMVFNRPEGVGNFNLIDIASAVLAYQDVHVVDDKVLIGATSSLYVLDFVEDTAHVIAGSGTYINQYKLADRNLVTSSDPNTLINSNMNLVASNVLSVHAKQDTDIKPEEHNGSETSVDNGEIYVAYGTSAGNGLIKWKAGLSFVQNTAGTWKYFITDDFSLIFANLSTSSGVVYAIGDIRKIYTDHPTVNWGVQTLGTSNVPAWSTELSNRYINDFDVKTIWRNGVAHNYIAVAEGQIGTSDAAGVDLIDVYSESVEVVKTQTSTSGQVSVCFGQDLEIWGAWVSLAGGAALINRVKRVDYVANPLGNTRWRNIDDYTSSKHEYWQLQDDVRDVAFSHNTICIAGDDGAQIIELPRGDSLVESQTVSSTLPSDPTKAFLVANEYMAPKLSDTWRERRIFSDATDTGKFTFTNGDTYAWADSNDAAMFGGNQNLGRGHATDVNQTKVSWTCTANTTELVVYMQRYSNSGKIDVVVNDGTSDVVSTTYNLYSAEAVNQDQLVIKGLDKTKTHTVTLTSRQDTDGSDRYFSFQGCVEIIDTGTAKTVGQIVHEVTFDGGTTWQDVSSSHAYNVSDLNHTANGTFKKRTKFIMNDSDVAWVNDEAIVYLK